MAILAACLYGITFPLSKILLKQLSPYFMASLLYLGAGIGMVIINSFRFLRKKESSEAKLTKKELPFIIAMILLDILAPVLLMLGIQITASSSVSLLNNFEIVATSLVALLVFKESLGKRMWIAVGLITLSSFILSFNDFSGFSFSLGSLFVILACICWGFENNCTRMLSLKDPLQIVVIKGFGSGIGALIIAFVLSELSSNYLYIALCLLLGFVAFGLSIFFYIKAQRNLGAARTSAYYASAPFIGVVVSWVVLGEKVTPLFLVALFIMIIGAYFLITEKHSHEHIHISEEHEHSHSHDDLHHAHIHEQPVLGEHSHVHTHTPTEHIHPHTQDMHHRHSHKREKKQKNN